MEDDPQGLSPKPASQRTRRQRSRFLTETSCARPELRRKSQPFAFDSTRSSDRQASTLWFAWQAATSSAEDDPNRWRDHRQHTIRDVARHRPDIRARIAMTDHGYDNQANRAAALVRGVTPISCAAKTPRREEAFSRNAFTSSGRSSNRQSASSSG